MKILILSHKFFPDIGGIETVSEILADNFCRAGHEVCVVTWSIDTTKKIFPFTVIRSPSLKKLLESHAWADLVFENNPCLRLSWPGIFFNLPRVVGLHTWIRRLNGTIGWEDRLKLRWLKRAKKVIACSDALRRGCWTSAIVIANPYKENIFRHLPNIQKDLHFIFLGRLVSDKGINIAISAFAELVRQLRIESIYFSELKFTIVGDGPEREPLKELVIKLGLEKNIIFTGALQGEKLVQTLNQHRFMLIPSLWEEPFGVVALEGMACGCIPIVSNTGGLQEAIGRAGLTFTKGEIDSLKQRMLELLTNSQLEASLRQMAGEHLHSHQSNEVSKQYLSVFKHILYG